MRKRTTHPVWSNLSRNQRRGSGRELQRPEAHVDDLDDIHPALAYRRVQHRRAIYCIDSLQCQTRRIDQGQLEGHVQTRLSNDRDLLRA